MASLAARGITKAYGPVQALIDAEITLAPGEVHAIVGENGAGKSTLAKILAGAVGPDAGTVAIDERPVRFRRRQDAIAAGIGFVPQALSLVGDLTLIENHALGQNSALIGTRRLRHALEEVAGRTGLAVALDVPVGRLSVAERQLGELLIALVQGARVVLLDEPTSLLGPRDVERLVRCLRNLAVDGSAVGLVTHRIAEVLEDSDRVTVLRGGRVVHHGPSRGLSGDALARMMIGERSRTVNRRRRRPGARIRLSASDLLVIEDGVKVLDSVRFSVREGEILGIAGVAGASQTPLAETLTGLRIPDAGTVTFDGTDITGAPGRAARLGFAHVADERALGLVGAESVAVNASLLRLSEPAFSRLGLRQRAMETRQGRAICAAFGVQPPLPGLPALGLSGGNQQKLILGRELERSPVALVVHSPTQGLDLSATAAIHNRLLEAADNGAAVVVISADLDEVLAISDRLLILTGGRVVDEIDLGAGPPDVARIGAAMASRQVGTAAGAIQE